MKQTREFGWVMSAPPLQQQPSIQAPVRKPCNCGKKGVRAVAAAKQPDPDFARELVQRGYGKGTSR